MTDTEKLAADIARVMELDRKRTQGEWNTDAIYKEDGTHDGFMVVNEHGQTACWAYDSADFIASAPLMADIIRQLLAVNRELIGALEQSDILLNDAQDIMRANIIPHGISNKDAIAAYIALLDNTRQRKVQTDTRAALALVEPLVKVGV